MKKTSETIIFFGNERLATGVVTDTPVLKALARAGYKISAVISSYEAGLSRKPRPLEISETARELNIPLLLPAKLRDATEDISRMKPALGVLIAYGQIVPAGIINMFPRGIINLHPSLLPKHRGPTPIESVILGGEEQTGVSIMQLSEAMDAGPVYVQASYSLKSDESKQEISDNLLAMGEQLIMEHLPRIIDGSLKPKPQDNTLATYDGLISKQDGIIDWTKDASVIAREIRAYLGWPGSRTDLHNKKVIITSATVTELSGTPGEVQITGKRLIVCCGNNALIINKLKPAGKNEMTGEAFLAGHRHAQ